MFYFGKNSIKHSNFNQRIEIVKKIWKKFSFEFWNVCWKLKYHVVRPSSLQNRDGFASYANFEFAWFICELRILMVAPHHE